MTPRLVKFVMDYEKINKTCMTRFKCDVFLMTNAKDKKSCYLSQFISTKPNQGNGTMCLNYIIETLRNKGVKKISLIASPLPYKNDFGVSERRLIKWYERFGFKIVEVDNNLMELVLSD